MLRHLLLQGGLALCSIAEVIAQTRIDLVVTPAWSGWTRPGRTTELDIRLTTNAPAQVALDIRAGRQVVRANVDLVPGRVVRLHVPVSSAEAVVVRAESPAGVPERRDVSIAQAESPLLGVGIATSELVRLDGFHAVALAASDLPRNASSYSSIDALILDAATLGALDQRQLGALLAHAAECGRIVLVNVDPGVRRVLDGAGECGGQSVMRAVSLTDAVEQLKSSLAVSIAAASPLPGMGGFARSGHVTWNRVLIGLAAYFAAAALGVMFFSSLPILLLMPVVATVAVLAMLHAMQPLPQLVVWSEGRSGAQIGRYQAWQQFPGLVRGQARVPVLPHLASARSCEPAQPMRFDFDAARGSATFAEFETRLFRQIALCYSGNFPLARAIAIEARPGGLLDVRNTGRTAWPEGLLLARGLVHELPALEPGGDAIIRAGAGKPLREDALMRTAMARTAVDGAAALWEFEPGRVAGARSESSAWLLVSIPPP